MKRLYSCSAYIDFCYKAKLVDVNTGECYDFIGYALKSYSSIVAFYSPWQDRFYFVNGLWDCSHTTHQHVRKFIQYVCSMLGDDTYIRWYSASNARKSFSELDGAIALVNIA